MIVRYAGIKIITPELKGKARLKEKIEKECGGDFSNVFDIGRFTVLCETAIDLESALSVIGKVRSGIVLAKIRGCIQATLHRFCTMTGHCTFERGTLSQRMYELWLAWSPKDESYKKLCSVGRRHQRKGDTNDALGDTNDVVTLSKAVKRVRQRMNDSIDMLRQSMSLYRTKRLPKHIYRRWLRIINCGTQTRQWRNIVSISSI